MNEIREIYKEAFGESPQFDALFFKVFEGAAKTLVVDGKTVSVLFLLPCFISGQKVYYLYAAATKTEERSKGYMSRLIKETVDGIKEPVFLKPAEDSLIAFYEKLGFYRAKGVNKNGDIKITVSDTQVRLSAMCAGCPDEFTLMFSTKIPDKTFEFPYIMQ